MSLPPLRAALAAHATGGEIIVVDNGSEDDTRAYVTSAFPEARVIALPRNEGFAGAANRGVAAARHATVILLNNDMVVEPDFVAPLLEALMSRIDTAGIVTGRDREPRPAEPTADQPARSSTPPLHRGSVERRDDV